MHSQPRISIERATDGGIVVVAHSNDGRPLRETGYSRDEAAILVQLLGQIDQPADEQATIEHDGYSIGGRS